MTSLARSDVLGVAITRADMLRALTAIGSASAAGQGGYVCFTNVHAVVTAKDDAEFRRVTNDSLMSLADGKPVYWFAHALRGADVGHVPGPDFMIEALMRYRDRRHFFYGSTPATLERLVRALGAAIPGLNVCGYLSPAFGAWSDAQKRSDYVTISDSRPDFVWVGLGAPKQEKWMSEACAALAPALLFGVGAAFDFHAGTASRAPKWMRHLGLEWLFRFASEPRRLWRRYLVTNTRFVWYVAASILSRRM